VFITPVDHFLDIAILRLDVSNEMMSELTLDDRIMKQIEENHSNENFLTKGQNVFAIGYPIFNSENVSPMWTNGLISNLIYEDGHIFMIQTTAPVYSGSSGGILISKDLKFLGIVTSNSKANGKILAHMNYSIPIYYLYPIVKYLQSNYDISYIQHLDQIQDSIKNKYFSDLWNLKFEKQILFEKPKTPSALNKLSKL